MRQAAQNSPAALFLAGEVERLVGFVQERDGLACAHAHRFGGKRVGVSLSLAVFARKCNSRMRGADPASRASAGCHRHLHASAMFGVLAFERIDASFGKLHRLFFIAINRTTDQASIRCGDQDMNLIALVAKRDELASFEGHMIGCEGILIFFVGSSVLANRDLCGLFARAIQARSHRAAWSRTAARPHAVARSCAVVQASAGRVAHGASLRTAGIATVHAPCAVRVATSRATASRQEQQPQRQHYE